MILIQSVDILIRQTLTEILHVKVGGLLHCTITLIFITKSGLVYPLNFIQLQSDENIFLEN